MNPDDEVCSSASSWYVEQPPKKRPAPRASAPAEPSAAAKRPVRPPRMSTPGGSPAGTYSSGSITSGGIGMTAAAKKLADLPSVAEMEAAVKAMEKFAKTLSGGDKDERIERLSKEVGHKEAENERLRQELKEWAETHEALLKEHNEKCKELEALKKHYGSPYISTTPGTPYYPVIPTISSPPRTTTTTTATTTAAPKPSATSYPTISYKEPSSMKTIIGRRTPRKDSEVYITWYNGDKMAVNSGVDFEWSADDEITH